MTREKEIYKVTLVGSAGNAALLTFKFIAGVLGNSSAMVADAVHSLSDFVTDILVLVFVSISAKPQDRSHDYGHGKFETIASFLIGLALVAAATGIVVSGILKLLAWIDGEELESPGWIALWAALLSIAIKELLYQSVPYVGFGRAHNFFGVVIKVFEKKGIEMPLPARSNTDASNRYVEGRKLQDKYFGSEMIEIMNKNTPVDQQHFNRFLEGFCFGDFYTRDGLDDQLRELITFVFIATLGGCENQLRGHTQGNLTVGNNKEKLISAITVIMPYIGFPRSLNALAIVNEICE